MPMPNGFLNIHSEFYKALKTFTKYRLGELSKTLMLTVSGRELPKTSELSRIFSMLILERKSKGTENVNIHSDYFNVLLALSNYRLGELMLALISAASGDEIPKISELSLKLVLQIYEKNGIISESLIAKTKQNRINGKRGGRPSKSETEKTKANQKKPSKSKSKSDTLPNQLPMTELIKSSHSHVKSDNDHDADTVRVRRQVEAFKDNIEYEYLKVDRQEGEIDAILSCVEEIFASKTPTIRIAKTEMPREAVVSAYLKLDSEHITLVLDQLSQVKKPITHIHAYIKTCLFRAHQEIDFRYQNLYNQHQSTESAVKDKNVRSV
jgi:hypothetical protein